MGRIEKATKNVMTGLINKAVLMILAFVTKTVFIRLLGAEYNGVSSLYSNILSVLALAELGVGNVLMFYLYSALKDGDEERICALVAEFKRIYNIIIFCVLAVGLALTPFLQYLVNSSLEYNELIVYYLLYLANSVASYFVVYRTMVLRADQKDYILNNVSTATTVVMYILQLAYLFICHEFLGYLVIQVFCTIGMNLIENWIALRQYPFLRKKVVKYADISGKELLGNVKATFLFKISDTILDQTDNIIISVMFGTVMVGMYANYYMIIMYLVNIAGIIVNGLIASFGNLYVEHDKTKSYKMFRCSQLFFAIYAMVCVTCYVCLIQDFVPLWVGAEYLIGFEVVFAISVVFYIRMVTNTVWIYRSTMGLFKEVQYINLVAAVLNIVLSIIFGKLIGVAGIIIATGLSRLATSFWYEGNVVYKKLGVPVIKYFKMQFVSLFVTLMTVSTCYFLCSLIAVSGMAGLILKVLICVSISLCICYFTYRKTEEFKIISQIQIGRKLRKKL